MAHSAQVVGTAHLTRPHVRLRAWLAGVLLALLAGLWLAPATAQAGTITIIDGPNTPPTADGVYTDGYINVQLAAGNLTIDTTSVVTGPNEIRVVQDAVITWTTGTELGLIAGANIIVSGTIQHNGPASGVGGLTLRAPDGTVFVGTGDQTAGVAVGSRHGLTRVQAGNLVLRGGETGAYAQLGFHAVDGGVSFAVSGAISVTVSQDVTATAGLLAPLANAQIGHGGDASGASGDFSGDITVEAGGNVTFGDGAGSGSVQLGHGGFNSDGERSGDHRLEAGGNVNFTGGSGAGGYAQMGNGGYGADGNHSGSHTLSAGGNVAFLGGSAGFAYVLFGNGGQSALGSHSGSHTLIAGGDVDFQAGEAADTFAQFGNGGESALGSHSGDHRLNSGRAVVFRGSADSAYAQFGNGGLTGLGNHSGAHRLTASLNVGFLAGSGVNAYAQFGNGGGSTIGSQSGGHSLTAGRDVFFQGGDASYAYAQFGNGGGDGNHSGDHRLAAGRNVVFQGGSALIASVQFGNGGDGADGNHSGNHLLDAGANVTVHGGSGELAYAQFGNGGDVADGSQSGSHGLNAGGDVTIAGGSGANASAQFGNGGWASFATLSGSLALTSTGSLTVSIGISDDAYALIGHGADVRANPINKSTGDRAGDIRVRVGATAVFSGSQVGHITNNGVLSVTQGNTLIGVSQNNPFSSGPGQLLVTGVISSHFNSAPTANGGELGIYLPREDSQQIPTSATFNGETFATANTIPAAQLAGIAPFGAGSYIPDYSFYLGGQPDVGIGKSAQQPGPLGPGDALTYTISFANTGTVTATGVVISDTLPDAVVFEQATVLADGGVVVTQTGSAPNLAWRVSGLGPLKDGQIVVGTTVQNGAFAATQVSVPVVLSPGATADVEVRSNEFIPDLITVTVGSTVRWTRVEGFHNVVADDNSFDNGAVSSSWTTFDQTFTAPGSFAYHCEAHGGAGGVGMSGVVKVVVAPEASDTFTNTATITATGDITLTNNTASVARSVAAGATLTVTKVVVGDPPGSAWQFTGSGGIGGFSVPAAGGSQSFTPLTPGAYTITETVQSGYTAAVSCTNGASGAASVEVTLAPGAAVTCTFTNSEEGGSSVRLRLPAVNVGP